MKKSVIIALALFLALPAVTFAGSATSRWDMTIGGYVKVDWGWADGGLGSDTYVAPRKSASVVGARERADAEYGVMYAGVGETRLNFLVKGPDVWGAKTSAFVEWDFRGAGYGNVGVGGGTYGNALIRHAFMKFDWANNSLLIGKYFANFNLIPITMAPAAYQAIGETKSGRVAQVKWSHTYGKNVSTSLAFLAPTQDGMGRNGMDSFGVDSPYARSMAPFLAGGLDYKSDACGKIGNTKLSLGASGLIGYTKEIWDDPDGRSLSDKTVKSWGVSSYAVVPIISEKNNNKAGAWAISGGAMAYSNIQAMLSSLSVSSAAYVRGSLGRREVAPTYFSWWATSNFWLSNSVSLNAFYASTRLASTSEYFKRTTLSATNPSVNDTYILNIAYDVNPAIRLIAEASQIYTQYGNDIATGSDRGKANTFRLAAIYFF